MAKNDNLTDFLTDVADAIREKKGTTDKINPQEFSNEIKGIKTSSSIWTGHADVEGLKAIGWDDEDIAYFQEHGVNWMEEDDEYHKVPEDNKALYGIINYDNYKDYKDVIVYLPKFDMSRDYGYQTFFGFTKMVGIPYLNWIISQLYHTFTNCRQLTCISPIDSSSATRLEGTFLNCHNLQYIPSLDTRNSKHYYTCFRLCYSMRALPDMGVEIIPSNRVSNFIAECISLEKVETIIDVSNSDVNTFLYKCYNLKKLKLKNLSSNIDTRWSGNILKESLLYMIENEAATEAITIILQVDAYARWANDPDILAALAAHPLVSLASE